MSKVLIVDSNSEFRDVLTNLITECSIGETVYRVQSIDDIEAALKLIQTSRIQILFLEWSQENDKAKALIREIRSNHRTRRIHVLVTSDHHSPEMISDALTSGGDDFLSRPIANSDIRTRLLFATNRQELLV